MEINKKDLCLVHIEIPKTGSSTLQETFFKGLEDSRVSYAKLPHPNQSGWAYGLFFEVRLSYLPFIEWKITKGADHDNR